MYEYPFGNGQQLNLDWFLNEWKNLLAAWEAEKNGIEGALQAEIDRAEAALTDIFAARDAAAQSAANALESKNAAAQSATDASGYLATVRADANTAHNAAQNAAQSKSDAAESAQTALASKNTAANSERNAAQSEANALTSKNAAAQSAADALANKNAAAQSAADALANKDAAAQSAEDAADSARTAEQQVAEIDTTAILGEYVDSCLPNHLTPNKLFIKQRYADAISGISGLFAGTYFDITRRPTRLNYGIAFSEGPELLEGAVNPTNYSLELAPGTYHLITLIDEYTTNDDPELWNSFFLRLLRFRNNIQTFVLNLEVTPNSQKLLDTTFTAVEGDKYAFYFTSIGTTVATKARRVRGQMFISKKPANELQL